MAEQGITSICDMALMPHPGCDFIRDDVYERPLRAPASSRCARICIPRCSTTNHAWKPCRIVMRATSSRLLRAPGFKQFFDGVSSQHTAWLTEPYANARFEGDCGRPTVPADRMRELVLAAAERGHSVRIHAIGDRAIHEALDIFEGRPRPGTARPCRAATRSSTWRTCCLRTSTAWPTLGSWRVPSPGTSRSTRAGPERDLGQERSRIMWPFATYAERGVAQAFGTDSPITAVTSMDVLYCAVTRQDPFTHEPAGGWLPGERISAADALCIYTAGSAAAPAARTSSARSRRACSRTLWCWTATSPRAIRKRSNLRRCLSPTWSGRRVYER